MNHPNNQSDEIPVNNGPLANNFLLNNEVNKALEIVIKKSISLLTKNHLNAKYIDYAFHNRQKIVSDIPKIMILLKNLRESFKFYYNELINYINNTYNGNFDNYILKDLEEMNSVFAIIENLADNASKKYIDGRMDEQLTIIIGKFENKVIVLKESSDQELLLVIYRYNQILITLIESISSIFNNLNKIEKIKKKVIKRCNLSGKIEVVDNIELMVIDEFENLKSMINIISMLSSLRIEKDTSLSLLYMFKKELILLKEIFDYINDAQKSNRRSTEDAIINAESFKLGIISNKIFASKLKLMFLNQTKHKDETYTKICRATDDLCDSLNLEDVLKTQKDTRTESYLNIFSKNRIKTQLDLKRKTSYCSIM